VLIFFVLIQVLGFVNRSFTSIKSISATRKKCNSKHKRKKVEKKKKTNKKGRKNKTKRNKTNLQLTATVLFVSVLLYRLLVLFQALQGRRVQLGHFVQFGLQHGVLQVTNNKDGGNRKAKKFHCIALLGLVCTRVRTRLRFQQLETAINSYKQLET